MMDGWDMTGWGWGWMGLMMLVGLLLIALVIVLILRPSPPLRPPAGGSSALEVLQRRYAAGEIDEAEYHRRLAGLMGSPSWKDPSTTPGDA